jgi:NAD(P)-dependent dehydrogenase (short-subunit alcohol dehydrogenase family)
MSMNLKRISLNGGVAVVTGAGGGIGAAIAAGLLSEGATVFLVGRRRERLEAVAAGGNAGHARVFPADLTCGEDIASIRDTIEHEFGHLDVLVHSAGVISHGSVEQGSISDFDAQYAANVRGPYLLTQNLLPLLKKCQGQIVFINSSAGLAARPNTSQFCATQAAFKAVADRLRGKPPCMPKAAQNTGPSCCCNLRTSPAWSSMP